jgi:hypothetical protein
VSHCGCGQAVGVTYFECVFVALGILNAMRNIFKHYLINGTIFGKKDIEHKMFCTFPLKLLSETCFILRRTEQDLVINIYWSSCKTPASLFRF